MWFLDPDTEGSLELLLLNQLSDQRLPSSDTGPETDTIKPVMSESITQSEEEQDESSQNVGGAFLLAGALKTSVKHKGRPVLIENSACLTQTQMNQMLSSIVHLCFCVSSLLEPRGQMELLSMSSVFIRDDWTHRKC